MLRSWKSSTDARVLTRFYKLSEAEAYAATMGRERVWACDRRKIDGTVGKYFVVASVQRFYEHICAGRDDLNWYELISKDFPCVFHLDIEVPVVHQTEYPVDEMFELEKRFRFIYPEISSSQAKKALRKYFRICSADWTDIECDVMMFFVCTAVDKFNFREKNEKREMRVLSSCRGKKFSIHVVCKDITFDRNFLSMRVYAYQLSRVLWHLVNRQFEDKGVKTMLARNDSGAKVLFRALMLEVQCDKVGWRGSRDTPIDEMIYTCNLSVLIVLQLQVGFVFLSQARFA